MRTMGGWRGLAVVMAVLLSAACMPMSPLGARPLPATDGCHRGGVRTRCSQVRFTWLRGFDDPATPDRLDRVGVLQVGPRFVRNVLVVNPGTSAGSGYFLPLAQDIVRRTRGQWQVWSVERRENQLEDQSVLDQAKQGKVTNQQLFDYYLGWLTDPSITNHFQLIPDSSVSFA